MFPYEFKAQGLKKLLFLWRQSNHITTTLQVLKASESCYVMLHLGL